MRVSNGLRLWSPPRVIVIVMGVSGAGKSTVGRLLARDLGCAFYDADDFHPPANIEKMRSGVPLRDADRAPWLRVLHDLLAETAAAGRSAVLACSALKASYRVQLAEGVAGVQFVYLRGDAALLRERMAGRRDHHMPIELLRSQLATLEEPADAIVADVSAPPDDIVARIRTQLR